jgi:hypothetical protein
MTGLGVGLQASCLEPNNKNKWAEETNMEETGIIFQSVGVSSVSCQCPRKNPADLKMGTNLARGPNARQSHINMKHRASSQKLRKICPMAFPFLQIKCTGCVPKFTKNIPRKIPIYFCILKRNRCASSKMDTV